MAVAFEKYLLQVTFKGGGLSLTILLDSSFFLCPTYHKSCQYVDCKTFNLLPWSS